MAAAIIVILAAILVLFLRDFGSDGGKPGVMVKVKIVINHVQIMSMLQQFDLAWPNSTNSVSLIQFYVAKLLFNYITCCGSATINC